MTTYCGYIALIGRPNAGKSTLLNYILQQKISITSRKPQTTRHSILGIHTQDDYQCIYVDTPGIHQANPKAMNKMMNRTAITVLKDVDIIVFLLEANRWGPDEDDILAMIKQTNTPCILAINKVDKIKEKESLLPLINQHQQRHNFNAIIPLSAKQGMQVDILQNTLKELLPEGPHFFADDQITDRPTRFLCAELLREKIFRFCGDELPYSTTVQIESFQEEAQIIRIHALIMVDKANHKRMIIGNKGDKLKEMASQARMDMEKLLDKKVFLQCWVKVKSGWSDDVRMLKQLGYDNG
ncbi:MAG: GTPase Era [Legionellaceae bacterium]|nr:GTPase Era [Legionellaceae bacterium]